MAIPCLFSMEEVSVPYGNGFIYVCTGWQGGMWGAAFFVGTSSLVLALVSLRRERKQRSRTGRVLAATTLVVAGLGASVWSFTLLVKASAGL